MLYYVNNILLSKNDETDVWMQILVYIIFAVIWLLGTVSKKMQQKQQEKNIQKHKNIEAKHPAQYKIKKTPAHPVSQSEIKTWINNNETTGSTQINAAKLAHIKSLQAKIQKLEMPKETEVKLSPIKPAHAEYLKQQEINFQQRLITDLTSEPDNLQKAILYQEILGKPISLRDRFL